MAGIKISELPEASGICGNELVPIVQGSCTKFVSASAIGGTGAGNITSITTGRGLEGGGTTGSINIEMDNNCFDAFNGAHTTLAAASANWESTYSTVESLSDTWDQSACAGILCVGDITGICVGGGITGGGATGTISVALDPVCTTAWNGTTTTVAANSASWGSGGTGDITGVTAGTLLSGGGTSGDVTIGIDSGALSYLDQSACAGLNCVGDMTLATNQTVAGNKCFTGNILSAGVNLDQLFGTGGGSYASISDDGTTVCINAETCINGNAVIGGVNDGHSMPTPAQITNSIIAGGSDGTANICANNSALIAGESNTIDNTHSAVIAGITNCVKHACSVIAGGSNITSVSGSMLHTEQLYVKDLPDTDPGVSGVIYQSSGSVKVSDESVTVSDVSGTASTFGSSVLYFSSNHVTYGPVSASVQGNYYKPVPGNETDELSVAFYSDAAEIEIKIERSQSSIQFYVDDVPVHEFAVAGYNNRLLKLSHSTAKVRKYEIRGKSYGFGGVYTNTSSSDYQVWPYETRRERPLLLVMTDSYGTAVNSTYGISFVEKLADLLDMDLHSDSLNSSGWSSTGSSATTDRADNQIALTRTPAVILACLGYNDKSSPNQTNIEAGINNWHSTVTGTFGSAAVMLASPWTPVGAEANLTTVSGYINARAIALGADFININGVVTTGNQAAYTSNDNTHPSAAGHDYLARRIQALMLRTGNVPSTY